METTRLLAGLVWATLAASAGTINGTAVDARGGEPLASAAVRIEPDPSRKAQTNAAGKFRLSDLPEGDYTLSVETVGYHTLKRQFHLAAGQTQAFEIVLSADNLRRTGPFETARQENPSTLTLASHDVKNLGSVLANDPLRAVQSLSGVTSDNGFDARFSSATRHLPAPLRPSARQRRGLPSSPPQESCSKCEAGASACPD